MSLRASLTVFDVGHGDHLLLRVADGDEPVFHAVVDCNWPSRHEPPPALERLIAWNVTHLDVLVLTHPHFDHFLGLAAVAEHFTAPGRSLGAFMDFGLDLRDVADQHREGSPARAELYRLYAATFSRRASGVLRPTYWPLRGQRALKSLRSGVALAVLAPSAGAWSEEHARLTNGQRIRPNRISSVLLWRVLGSVLLLGGDLELDGWQQALAASEAEGLPLTATW